MMSLRKTILFWVTIAFVAVSAVAVATTYYFTEREANSLLDTQLHQIALYASDGPASTTAQRKKDEIEDRLVIQIWDAAGQLVFHTPPTHKSPAGLPPQALGFVNVDDNGVSWRVYTDMRGGQMIQVAQRWSARRELARKAAVGAALPLLGAIPIACLVIILVINRLMTRLSAVATALAERSIDAEGAVSLGDLPREIAPLNEAINRLIGRYQRAVAQQRQLVSDAAHELRTPLAALQIQVNNLQTRLHHNAGDREAIDDLGAGVRRAGTLVEQLLRMARLDEPAAPARPKDIGLADLLAAVVADQIEIAAEKTVDLGLAIRDRTDIRLSEAETKSLFANLIDNAIRYTPGGGAVDVRLRREAGTAIVEVIDSGCGIADDALPRVFDRFFRAASADTVGNGLGLAIAKRIADRNGFTLTIANRDDTTGTIARVVIPAAG